MKGLMKLFWELAKQFMSSPLAFASWLKFAYIHKELIENLASSDVEIKVDSAMGLMEGFLAYAKENPDDVKFLAQSLESLLQSYRTDANMREAILDRLKKQ